MPGDDRASAARLQVSFRETKVGHDLIVVENYIAANEVPGIWVGVPTRPAHFVGRDELVHDLVIRLVGGDYQALAGEAKTGAGKTTLAVALAHHRAVLNHFKDGVLWAGLGPTATEAEVVTIFNRWANALGIDVTGEAEVADRKRAVADAIGQRRLLIVIDDAWDINVAKLLRFGNPYCCHLLTTRDKGFARQFAGVKGTFSVPMLNDDAAFELLRELAPEACAADPAAAGALARVIGGLPLTLELVGGYLAVPERSLLPKLSKAALQEMMDPQRRLHLAQEHLGAPGRDITLQDTIALSLEGLRELAYGAQAERAFYALGAFAPQPEQFSWEAAEVVAKVDSAILALLVARNLVDDATGGQLALHQTLADVAQAEPDEAAQARHRAYYLSVVNENRQDWHRIEVVYGQVRWAWRSVPEDRQLLNFVWAVRVFQGRRGLWRDYLEWAQRGLNLAATKEWRREEATLLNNIGGVYHNLGQREKALEYYNRALPIREEVGNRAGLATTLSNIGAVYNGLGQREKALEYYNRALPIMEEVGDRAGESVTLYNMAMVYRAQGRLVEARAALEQVVELDRLVESPDLEDDASILAQVEAELTAKEGK